jgi:HAD superfamily hydrolase (TIGR01549 family)
MAIKAIFYDLDGTLRMNEPHSWRVFTDFASTLGFNISKQDVFRIARWEHSYFANSSELIQDRNKYLDGSEFWTNYGFRQLIELGASLAQAVELAPLIFQHMNDAYHPTDVIPEDLVETLKLLKQKGVMLGVLSNRSESYSDYLIEKGLGEYFSLAIFAAETGTFKPDPAIFHYLLEKAGIPAAESFYVGDNYYADVVGSRAAGMNPVLLDVEGLFDQPDCPVIQKHPQILDLL